ncbi:MAG: hypothetical protein LBQ08_04090 [Holosporaceae bacterium]|jgi:hypothetical protein|nr:hypothetical protein [Holosporaceae bacterium]
MKEINLDQRNMYDNLDTLMEELKIIDRETKAAPDSEKERCVIKIQLLAAQIIIDDMRKIQKISPHLSSEEIVDQLLYNWTANIKDFILAMTGSYIH